MPKHLPASGPAPWRLVPPAVLAGAVLGLVGGFLLGRGAPAEAFGPGGATGPPAGLDEETARQMEEYRARIQRWKDLAAASPDDPEPPLRVADMYFEVRLFDLAVPWYERSLAAADSPAVRNDLGFTLFQAGDPRAAVATLRTLTQAFPEYARGWLALGVVLAHSEGDPGEVAAAFARAVELDPVGEVGAEARRQLAGLGESA